MLEKFIANVRSKELFKPSDRLLVAVSGGLDSMVLCHLLKKGGFSFSVAHCNFKLRGLESDGDEEFVMSWSKSADVEFFHTSFSTKTHATKNGLSIQMAARELRYEWFNALIVEHSFDFLLTAHHVDDSLETVLFNLAKGTGLRGLTGIEESANHMIRPLSIFSREEILEYGLKNELEWREDESNKDLKYHRNMIRHTVIPMLKKINPSLLHTYRNTQNRMITAHKYLESSITEKFIDDIQEREGDIFIKYNALRSAVELEYLLRPYGFNFSQLTDILEAARAGQSGKVFKSGTHQLNIDRQQLIISRIGDHFVEFRIDENDETIEGAFHVLKCDKIPASNGFSADSKVAHLDLGKLTFPLIFRKWQNGDSFYPLGAGGKKKVSDYMIDSKIPVNLKHRVGVIESAGKIIWLVGHRIDDRFKITSSTEKIYRIAIK